MAWREDDLSEIICLEDNIRMNRKEIGMGTKNWVDSAQNRDY